MPRLEFSQRFVNDLAQVESDKVQERILKALDNVEAFGAFGSSNIPESIRDAYGHGVRRIAVNPFDLIYTYYPESDLVRVEALVHQRTVR